MRGNELVIILDFGSQYSNLIARRVREADVYCEIVQHDIKADKVRAMAPKGIILSGGPSSVYEDKAPQVDPAIFALGVPVLGICYGMQLMAKHLGGSVERAEKREYGKAELMKDEASCLFKGIGDVGVVWMSHGDSVVDMPKGFVRSAWSDNTPVAAMEDRKRMLYGVQFHPEVKHTLKGQDILNDFLFEVCKLAADWTPGSFIEEAIADVRERAGGGKVLCALSGGVDSSVAAVLVHKAVGDNLTCVFVDHGLLRKGEAEQVESVFRQHFHMNLITVDAKERFLRRLEGITDPERKRKIIGEEFIRVFEEEAKKLGKVDFLVQGTLYPDVIESTAPDTAGTAVKIKSHHNVGGLPEKLGFKLIEPLRYLFKDEVRRIGLAMGLSEDIVWRQPFPGPGLAVRVIGAIDEERLSLLREADAIVTEEIKAAGLYRSIWQSFAVLPGVRSVGVMGDKRTYSELVAVRAVISDDGMTADWAKIPYDVLERISTRIVNEVHGVNRVCYDITMKPPSTIEWE